MDDVQHNDLRSFGLAVARARHARRWTQAQLAVAAGIDRSYVAQIESGRRNVGVTVVWRLARGLDVPPGDLFAQ